MKHTIMLPKVWRSTELHKQYTRFVGVAFLGRRLMVKLVADLWFDYLVILSSGYASRIMLKSPASWSQLNLGLIKLSLLLNQIVLEMIKQSKRLQDLLCPKLKKWRRGETFAGIVSTFR